jgi:hypothetical protein
MPLVDVALPAAEPDIPADVRRFIAEADRRIDRFQHDCRVPGFVAGDYLGAYRVLRAVGDSVLARGRRFCEWGSGFGVTTCLAALLDFDACGIEVEGALVEEARRLAGDYEIPVEFAHGSFVPRGGEDRVNASGSYSWLTTEADDAYDDLDLEVADLDIVFAYPWPDEEAVTGELFERYAGVGALLVSYHGGDDFRLRRKIAKRRRV